MFRGVLAGGRRPPFPARAAELLVLAGTHDWDQAGIVKCVCISTCVLACVCFLARGRWTPVIDKNAHSERRPFFELY